MNPSPTPPSQPDDDDFEKQIEQGMADYNVGKATYVPTPPSQGPQHWPRFEDLPVGGVVAIGVCMPRAKYEQLCQAAALLPELLKSARQCEAHYDDIGDEEARIRERKLVEAVQSILSSTSPGERREGESK